MFHVLAHTYLREKTSRVTVISAIYWLIRDCWFISVSVQRDSVAHLAQLDLATADCTVRETHAIPYFLITNNSQSIDWYILTVSFIGSHGNSATCDFLSGWVPPAADSNAVESQWSDAHAGNHTHAEHTQTHTVMQCIVFLFPAALLSVSAETSGVWACEDSWFSPHCCTVSAVRHITSFHTHGSISSHFLSPFISLLLFCLRLSFLVSFSLWISSAFPQDRCLLSHKSLLPGSPLHWWNWS